jgi:hypothetical protein
MKLKLLGLFTLAAMAAFVTSVSAHAAPQEKSSQTNKSPRNYPSTNASGKLYGTNSAGTTSQLHQYPATNATNTNQNYRPILNEKQRIQSSNRYSNDPQTKDVRKNWQ